MSCLIWLNPRDCDPPHGLDLTVAHDAAKVDGLIHAFRATGFDRSQPALVGYVKDGRIQLLSGTHRHFAARCTDIDIPVTLWLGSDIDKSWGVLEEWAKVMKDISVSALESWTREDMLQYQNGFGRK